MTVKERLETDPDIVPRMSKTSIKRYFDLFKAVCDYGVSLDPAKVGGLNYLHYDISLHLKYKYNRNTDVNSYSPFNDEELSKLFTGHIYNDEKFENYKLEDYMFWMPLLAVFTGARINEIAQLYCTDIKEDKKSGIKYINIGDDKKISL